MARTLLRDAKVSSAMKLHRWQRWSRRAALAAIPLVGALLLAVVWWTVSTVRVAWTTSARGEAASLHAELRAELFGDAPEVPTAERLAAVVDAHRGDGLRYLAVVDERGAILVSAGGAAASPAELTAWIATARSGVPEAIDDDHARVFFRRVPRNPERRRPRFSLLLELRPQVARELATTSRWLSVTGTLAALTLTGLAAVLVLWSLRRERAVREAEQARRLATLGQMSAVLAHEIRNPLASLKGNAQLLAAGLPEGDRVRAKADRVVDEATRLETLSNDLLEFAREGELRVVDVDPAALVREAADAAAPGRVDVDATGAPRTWSLDAGKVRQVLINLLENAARLGDGPIDARVTREAGALTIAIRDHGPGIAEADLPHVFEPFFTRRTRGTGLGLAVAKRLVDLHGGALRAGNAPGGGAIFEVSIPRQ